MVHGKHLLFLLLLSSIVFGSTFVSMAQKAHKEEAHIAELGAKSRIFANRVTKMDKWSYMFYKKSGQYLAPSLNRMIILNISPLSQKGRPQP